MAQIVPAKWRSETAVLRRSCTLGAMLGSVAACSTSRSPTRSAGRTLGSRPTMAATSRILVVVTNVGEYEAVGYRTGQWLGELTHFWDVAEKAGYAIAIASPADG
jgi:hypothetical protein